MGGALEDLARDRSAAAIAVGVAVTGLKAAAGLLALALNLQSGLPRRLLVGGNAIASLALILWGGINVVVGALVLGDVIVPEEDVDEHALRWHVFVWDLWFLVWGLFVALATARYRRHARKETPAPGP